MEGLPPEGHPHEHPRELPRQQREPQPRAVIGGGTCGSPQGTSWLHIRGWDCPWHLKGFGKSCCFLGSAVMRWPGAHLSRPSVLPVSVTPPSQGGGALGPQEAGLGSPLGGFQVQDRPSPPCALAQKLSFWDPCKQRNKGQLSPRE